MKIKLVLLTILLTSNTFAEDKILLDYIVDMIGWDKSEQVKLEDMSDKELKSTLTDFSKGLELMSHKHDHFTTKSCRSIKKDLNAMYEKDSAVKINRATLDQINLDKQIAATMKRSLKKYLGSSAQIDIAEYLKNETPEGNVKMSQLGEQASKKVLANVSFPVGFPGHNTTTVDGFNFQFVNQKELQSPKVASFDVTYKQIKDGKTVDKTIIINIAADKKGNLNYTTVLNASTLHLMKQTKTFPSSQEHVMSNFARFNPECISLIYDEQSDGTKTEKIVEIRDRTWYETVIYPYFNLTYKYFNDKDDYNSAAAEYYNVYKE